MHFKRGWNFYVLRCLSLFTAENHALMMMHSLFFYYSFVTSWENSICALEWWHNVRQVHWTSSRSEGGVHSLVFLFTRLGKILHNILIFNENVWNTRLINILKKKNVNLKPHLILHFVDTIKACCTTWTSKSCGRGREDESRLKLNNDAS